MNGPEGFSQCTRVPGRYELMPIPFPSWGNPTARGWSLFQNNRPHTWKCLTLMGIWYNEFPPWGTWFTCRSASVVLLSILPSVSLWVQSVWCVCLTARLCFTSQLLCLHTQLVFALTQVPAGAKGQAQSTATKSKGNAAPFKSDYYVSYLNLLPGICKWEVTKMYCNPFISYNFYIAWLLSDEIALGWMKRQMLTEPSLALLLDHLQEVRVAWLWKHPFRLSPCLPALSCHM